jgi:hypothetical protein
MTRPTSITIIGIIFIIAGCLTTIDVIYKLFHDHLYINLAVLMIPAGIGILKGRSSSRGWAKFWIGLFSLILGLLLVLYPFYGDSYSVTWFHNELAGTPRHIMAIMFPAVILSLAYWMWRCLSATSSAPFFDDYQQTKMDQTKPNK